MFQDLIYSLEIAAHEAELEHYFLQMSFDTVSGIQRYQECLILQDWQPPATPHAVLSFELGALDIARSQMSDREIARAMDLPLDDEAWSEEETDDAPLSVYLNIQFSLPLDFLNVPPSEAWDAYRSRVAERDRLQAGLENLKHKLERAIAIGDERPELRGTRANVRLAPSGRLILDALETDWEVIIQADLPDDLRQPILEDLMRRVRAGLEALDRFAQDIKKDFSP